MTTFIALLRAVNVAGRTLSMAGLRDSLTGLGFANVRTYLQSGNAVFDADDGPSQKHAAAVEVRIERDYGPRVAVLVMTADDIARVAAANPFFGDPDIDEECLHATFLFSAASESDWGTASEAAYSAVYEAAFDKLDLPVQEGERAAYVGVPALGSPVVYLSLPHGYGRTKLSNAAFERWLGTAATTRNWRTVRALVELVQDHG